ncbi:MAG: hypothetical protein HZB14_00480 [Actinobacteria bacterium]|nr:hypothetical protein [Actinomycetota bacterium]
MLLLVAAGALLLLAGCGDDKKDGGSTQPVEKVDLSADLTVKVDEKAKTFKLNKSTAKAGTVKITVQNPTDAKGQHGIGITGEALKDIDGAAVKPGRSTSLTVDLKPGDYEVYDSYKNNRKEGYTADLKVEKK